jgi:GT2 family glycosyltransferase
MHSSTIIVPVFNQAALTAQCLELLCHERRAQIIVVDDASSTQTRKVLHGFKRKVKILTHQENLGFSASCNRGASAAQGDYLVFLNNDTIPQVGWLAALEQYALEHPEAAIIGAKLLYPNQTIQHAGVVICQDRYPRHIYTGFPSAHPAVNKSRRFQLVTAACMLVRREVFDTLGGFDCSFHNGFEDVDLCLRAGERQLEVHYCAHSVVQHLESVTPGRFRHDRENVALYRARWLRRVRPDDLQYYVEDDLLRISYEGQFPFNLKVSPLLASLDLANRTQALERQLREQTRELSELLRENTRLNVQLGEQAHDSPLAGYQSLREQVRETVEKLVPRGGKVAVVTKGDSSLLSFTEREGWHFPQTEFGAYAGHHPANSEEAIEHLEKLRGKGAQYFVIPAPSSWWLEHYAKFRQHLDSHYGRRESPDASCSLYDLEAEQSRLERAINPARER